jgi:replicative DNA helicase
MKQVRPAIESEKTILGAILLDNSAFRVVKDMLCAADFGIGLHKSLFETMVKLYNKHHAVDIPMLLDELKPSSKNETYLFELANCCSSTSNIKAHAEIVREKSVQRHLLDVAQELGSISHAERLANFLQEVANEIRVEKIDVEFLNSALYEVSKAIVLTSMDIQDEE